MNNFNKFLFMLLLIGLFSCDDYEYKKVCDQSGSECVYFIRYSRGPDYERILISDKKKSQNSLIEFNYSGATIYYKVANDTLVVYCRDIAIQSKIVDYKFPVKIIALSNQEIFRIRRDWRQMNLQKF